ncbi:hypothetical protein D3C85_1500160 [compost metagenome]
MVLADGNEPLMAVAEGRPCFELLQEGRCRLCALFQPGLGNDLLALPLTVLEHHLPDSSHIAQACVEAHPGLLDGGLVVGLVQQPVGIALGTDA